MATTPNLLDYLAFLYGIAGVDPENFPSASGVATDGDALRLVDSTQAWSPGEWVGETCIDLTQGVSPIVGTSDSITVNFTAPLDNPVLAGDGYIIAPPVFQAVFNVAMSIVNDVLACAAPDAYSWAVYNLATDRLINFAPDEPGQTYWADKRKFFRLLDTRLGVVQSASDESTSVSYLNPEQFKHLTLGDLQKMKTPYGREYLAIAQDVGFTAYGMS